jgi:hypothetical protein
MRTRTEAGDRPGNSSRTRAEAASTDSAYWSHRCLLSRALTRSTVSPLTAGSGPGGGC